VRLRLGSRRRLGRERFGPMAAAEALAWALGPGAGGGRALLTQCLVEDRAFLRALAEPYLLGTLVLLGRPDRRGLPIFAVGAVLCLSVAALHVHSL
jgi:hypothetical protein